MKVLIDPDLEKLVKKTVESDGYDSPSEVVREALLAFLKSDSNARGRLRRLQKDVREGLSDVEQGRVAELDRKAIKQQARRRLSSLRET